MTDEKKNPEEDEVSDEQLDEVAGGTLASTLNDVARASFLEEQEKAAPFVSTTQDSIANLTDSIKEIADIQKTTLDSTNT